MFVRLIVAVMLVVAAAARAQAEDPVLRRVLEEAGAATPELAQARARVRAEQARIPQAGALPDPTLALAIQNDGFDAITIGTAETSFVSFMLTQPLPWFGKRGLREEVASLEKRKAEARFSRASLDLEGAVRRAYLGLQISLAQAGNLRELEELWTKAEQSARVRYEAGQVAQADLLRARLQQARLTQQRWTVSAQAGVRLAELNRLRGRPLDEPVSPATRLDELPDPEVRPESDAEQDAEARSPELSLARLEAQQAGRRLELAGKDRFPDVALTGGLMVRGSLPPMWQLGFSVGLPLFAGRKQARAVEEAGHRETADELGAEALRRLLRLRTRERLAVLFALNRTNGHYRKIVLVLSQTTARSTLAQYEVGRVPFASVLEALSGYVADRTSWFDSVAEAQLVAIAVREVSLDPVPFAGSVMSASPMPGGGASSSTTRTSGNQSSIGAETASPQRMGGM